MNKPWFIFSLNFSPVAFLIFILVTGENMGSFLHTQYCVARAACSKVLCARSLVQQEHWGRFLPGDPSQPCIDRMFSPSLCWRQPDEPVFKLTCSAGAMTKENIFKNFIVCSNSFCGYLLSSQISEKVCILSTFSWSFFLFLFSFLGSWQRHFYSEGKDPRTHSANCDFIRSPMSLLTYKRQTWTVCSLSVDIISFLFWTFGISNGKTSPPSVCFQALSPGMIN